MFVGRSFSSDKKITRAKRAPGRERSDATAPNSISSDLSFVCTNDQSNSHLDVCDACPGVCEVEKNKKSKTITKTRTRKTGLRPARSPFSFLRCSAGILPALLLLVSPFSGTGTPVCAPLLRRNPSNLGFATASHSMNARGEAQARPTKDKFLIAKK